MEQKISFSQKIRLKEKAAEKENGIPVFFVATYFGIEIGSIVNTPSLFPKHVRCV